MKVQTICRRKAFTLIELLIVVAIIAILAAIAVPNFLEAQTRAKVSRVEADMRSIATGLESYFVDNNRYPAAPNWQQSEEGLAKLTTPISYLSSIPNDPFRDETLIFFQQNTGSTDINPIRNFRQFVYQSFRDNDCAVCFANDYARFTFNPPVVIESFDVNSPSLVSGIEFPYGDGFQLRSMGPDRLDSFIIPYDPTNGTISEGDLGRWGPGDQSTAQK